MQLKNCPCGRTNVPTSADPHASSSPGLGDSAPPDEYYDKLDKWV